MYYPASKYCWKKIRCSTGLMHVSFRENSRTNSMRYFYQTCLNCTLLPSTVYIGSPHRFPAVFVQPFSFQELYASNVKAVKTARKHRITTKDVTWNAIITGHWQNGFPEESRMFEKMLVKIVSWKSRIAVCNQNENIYKVHDYPPAMLERNTVSSMQ